MFVGEQRQFEACDEFYIYVSFLIYFDLVAVFMGEQLDALGESSSHTYICLFHDLRLILYL